MTAPGNKDFLVREFDLLAALAALKSEILGGAGAAFDTLQELATALGNDPNFATTLAGQINGKAPASHKHAVPADLTTTGTPSVTTFLNGAGTWATPTNTTYTLITQAVAEAGTAVTANLINAAVLKGTIQKWVTGSYTVAVTSIGQALNKVANAAEARDLIGAGTSNLTLGTTAGTAKSGDYAPAVADVTGLVTALAAKVTGTGVTQIVAVTSPPTNPVAGVMYVQTEA